MRRIIFIPECLNQYLEFGEKVKNLVFKKSTNNSINPPKADKCE